MIFFLVSLTKTDKKGIAMKQHIIEDIQSCCDKYENIFLFSVENMRNSKLKEVRTEWRHSRFFFGKNRVMQLGLKNFVENDDASNLKSLNELSDRLTGQCGLLFTNKGRQEVLDWFETYSEVDFARAGFSATETVELPPGPMPEFSHAIEPHLRSLGMPTKLEKGIVTLYKEYLVCKEGQILTPEQAKILKLITRPMAEFKLNIECCWIKETGFELIKNSKVKRLSNGQKPSLKKDKKHKKKKEKKLKKAAEKVEADDLESDNDNEDEDENAEQDVEMDSDESD